VAQEPQKQNEKTLSRLLEEVRELKAQVAALGQVKNPEGSSKLLFDFSTVRKQDVMMHFVELYERFAILGTKDSLQRFLSEQTNLGAEVKPSGSPYVVLSTRENVVCGGPLEGASPRREQRQTKAIMKKEMTEEALSTDTVFCQSLVATGMLTRKGYQKWLLREKARALMR